MNAVIECIKVSLTLKKGDYAAYLDLKRQLEQDNQQGIVNIYESDPAVKEIWLKGQKFDDALAEIEADTELDDSESKLLFKAIKADLERKNRKNELGDDSVTGTVLKLLLTRQIGGAFDLLTTFTRRRAQR